MKTKLLITGIALMALTALAGAQNPSSANTGSQVYPGRGAYVDANNDGICDYYNLYGRRFYNRTTGNVQALGNRRGLAPGQGRGIARGQGRGMGPGQGRGLAPGGRNFIDENKNGICDLYEDASKK